MKKTILGRSGIETGAIGLGLEHLEKAPFSEVEAVIEAALEYDVSYMDLFMASAQVRDHVGRLMKGRRERFQIQGHIGACLQEDGQYFRSRDPVRAGGYAEELLTRLGTDYLDVLMLHFVDERAEWAEAAATGGILEIAERWKQSGRARAIGMSSHKVAASMAAVESGRIDLLMFPVNPAFDLLPGETRLESLWEADPYTDLRDAGRRPVYSRRELYLACERQGVAIVAMKPFAAGWMFRSANPSGITLTAVQCLDYALSQPGVRVVVPGCRTPEEVRASLAWLTATDAERDYTRVLESSEWNLSGSCMYCNHCLPCPVGIDIAATMRLFDGARERGVTPALSASYEHLPASAASCLTCGECEERCPFGVPVAGNMAEAAKLFG